MKFCINYILPILIGALIAVFVQKPSLFIAQKIKISHSIAALITALIIYLTVFSLIALLIFLMYLKLDDFYEKLPLIFEKIISNAKLFTEKINSASLTTSSTITEGIHATVTSFVQKTADIISNSLTNIIASVPQLILSTFVAVVSGCYIAKDFHKIKKFLLFALPETYLNSLSLLKKIFSVNIVKLLKSYIILAFVAFAEMTALFLIFGIKGALYKAAIIAIVDMLPVFGAGTVLIPWAIFAALFGNFALAVKLIVVYVVVSIVRNVLESKIIGGQIGVHPVITLLAILLGLKIFGVYGMFVLPLTTAVIFNYIKEKYDGLSVT